MKKTISIAVTSKSFSRHPYLCKTLKNYFDRVSLYEEDLSEQKKLIEFLDGHDAAIVGLDQISREVIHSLPNIKAIAKYGVGLDNVDIEALKERNVYLGWTPGVNARSVSELTLCFMLGMMRNVFGSGYLLKGMEWEKNGGYQLTNKTIGIIGCGHIGKDVVRLLAPFRCEILVKDIVSYDDFYRETGVTPVSLDELLGRSDIVSLHVPIDSSTHHMINEKTLGLMKKSAYLINTCRGSVVKTDDLKKALENGEVAGAALDVFEVEPPTDGDLLGLKNLMVTPHIGGNAEEAVRAMGESAIRHLVEFFSSNRVA